MVLPYIKMNLPQVYMCSPSWTLLPPPSPYHPSGSSQCTSPKHPVSCIDPGLATHFIYDIIHISMPFSQIIPPSPSPRVQKTVLYDIDFEFTECVCVHLSACAFPKKYWILSKVFSASGSNWPCNHSFIQPYDMMTSSMCHPLWFDKMLIKLLQRLFSKCD